MKQYYFLSTLLPPLSFDAAPEISFEELQIYLEDNLSSADMEKIHEIRKFYDILNLRAFLKGEAFNERGDMDASQIEEALASQVGFPPYVYTFLETYPNLKDRIDRFPCLLAQCFQHSLKIENQFLKNYFSFERSLRLVLTAFRARKLGRNLSEEFIYEDPNEDLIAQLLALQNAPHFEPPEEFLALKPLFEKFGNSPLDLHRELSRFRCETIDNMVDPSDLFSTDRILAYFTEYIIIELWFKRSKSQGIQIIDTLFKGQ